MWVGSAGGYFSAAGDDPSILMRAKEDYDGAEPAASSIAAANLFKLAALISGPPGRRYDQSLESEYIKLGTINKYYKRL